MPRVLRPAAWLPTRAHQTDGKPSHAEGSGMHHTGKTAKMKTQGETGLFAHLLPLGLERQALDLEDRNKWRRENDRKGSKDMVKCSISRTQ